MTNNSTKFDGRYEDMLKKAKDGTPTMRQRVQETKKKQAGEKVVIDSFIFDSNQVFREKPFTSLKLNNETFAYGLLLPKNISLYNKSGKFLRNEQEFKPVLITSNHKLIEVGKPLEEEYKIKINTIPSLMPLRWRLEKIKAFLDAKEEDITLKDVYLLIKPLYMEYNYFVKNDWYNIHSLWDIMTYFFMLFNKIPIFELRGIKRSGKSKVMDLSRLLTLNASKRLINPSEATLFRETHSLRYTKYVDEAEKIFFDNKGNVTEDGKAELINASYEKGSVVPRVEKLGNKWVTMYFSVFSPTMIGSINGLRGATEDRAIVHVTAMPPRGNPIGDIEINEEDPIFEDIRNKLYLCSLKYWKEVEETYLNLENDTKLKDRDYAIWKPLLVISKIIDEKLYLEVVEFAEKQTNIKQITSITEDDYLYKLLFSFKKCLEETGNKATFKNIYYHYVEEYGEEFAPKNSKTLARKLDKLGFNDYKLHFRDGDGYELNIKEFESIVYPFCHLLFEDSNLSSFASSSSQPIEVEEIVVKVSEGNKKNVKKKSNGCEASEVSEASEAKIELKEKRKKMKKRGKNLHKNTSKISKN